MASIQSLGVGSDLLTTKLVEDIIGAERQGADLRIDANKLEVEAKISVYGEVKSALSKLDSAISALNLSSSLSQTTASAANSSVLSATTTSIAKTGSYSVEVSSLATAHSLATERFSNLTDSIGTGTLKIAFGETQYDGGGNYTGFVEGEDASHTINITDGSLSGVRDAINDADAGVTATIVNDGVGFRLLITSEKAGKGNSLEITSLSGSGLEKLEYSLAKNNPANNLEELSRGVDAEIKINGLDVVAESNKVVGVIPGVTLNLTETNVGSPTTLSISRDVTGATEKINAFVEGYNELHDLVSTHTAYNADKQEAGLLLGDSTLRTVFSQLRSMLGDVVPGLENTRYRTLSEVGVSLDQFDDYKLSFDASKLTDALNDDAENVTALFATQGSTSDSNIEFVSSGIIAKAGDYDLVVTQLATQGTYEGQLVAALDFSAPVIIDADNNNFTIKVDGTSASVSLTQGSYATGAALAQEIQSQINGAGTLSSKGTSAVVAYNASNKSFDITSNKYGSESSVSFTSVDTNSANSLGFTKPGQGAFTGVALSRLGSADFTGAGSHTLNATQTVDSTTGMNFLTTNATFSLDIGGGAVAVTVNQNAEGNDLNGDSVFGDRKDILQAIQNGIDATALSGDVIASFNDDDRLVFTTTAVGAAQSIEITAVGGSATDNLLGLKVAGPQINGDDAGVTINAGSSFKLDVNGVSSADITVPAGNYLTGDALASAVETAINADAALIATAVGAETGEGTRDISTLIDFTTEPAGFTLSLNGSNTDILVNTNAGVSNIDSIQAAMDAVVGAGVVTASLGASNGLVLTTVATGPGESVSFPSSGSGAFTTAGTQALTGLDFTGNNANFDLIVDGITLNVAVDGDGTSGTNDAASTLTVIQTALDTALVNSGSFSAGDIVAKLDGSNQLVFESQSRNGVKTASTFGSSASIELANITGGNAADTLLGLTASIGTYTNGFDSFGNDTVNNYGNDAVSNVTYKLDADTGLGQLVVNVGNNNTIKFQDVASPALISLGIHVTDGSETTVVTGKDVAGTINGVEAKGSGLFLTAQDGNDAATNGFYLNTKSFDFSSPVVIDSGAASPNNEFTVNIDGETQAISIPSASYITGDQLASAIQTAINDNAAFKAKNISASVDFEDDIASINFGKIGIISNSTGVNSEVRMTAVPAGTAATLGFGVGLGGGAAGKAQVGEVDDASGIRLKVQGNTLGDRGTISFVSGVADRLSDLLDIMLGSKGSIANKENLLEDRLTSIEEEKVSLDARFSAQEARLKSQFAFNDAIIASLNTTQDFLTQQFEALAKALNNK